MPKKEKVYPLSQDEREEVKKFIQEQLHVVVTTNQKYTK